ncbi:hypothetical protein H9P43_008409 [Blastocladiella emersonii ATCC 22665]|nr:hypothetical protein H9P43_008409 [Blastocladiella emersonii ATCC 22665]
MAATAADIDPPALVASTATSPSSPFVFPFAAATAAVGVSVLKWFIEFPHIPLLTEKKSFFNVYFAKYAWAWTSVVFFLALARMRHWPHERRLAALVRYSLATAYWITLTQWFFGAPLLDRFNREVGGKCALPGDVEEYHPDHLAHFRAHGARAANIAACRGHGGVWTGGHDVSGHCLLLVHSFLFLQLEFLVFGDSQNAHTRPEGSKPPAGDVVNDALARRKAASPFRAAKRWINALSMLWVAMLGITMMYYHTLPELVNGIIAGTLFSAVVYSPAHMG